MRADAVPERRRHPHPVDVRHDFQRRLIQAILHPIIVNPARTRKRAFDPGRLEIVPKA